MPILAEITVDLVSSLVNAGGMGTLAAVLFYLHTSATKSFREELKAERDLFKSQVRIERDLYREEITVERETCERRHQETTASLDYIRRTLEFKVDLSKRLAEKMGVPSGENPTR